MCSDGPRRHGRGAWRSPRRAGTSGKAVDFLLAQRWLDQTCAAITSWEWRGRQAGCPWTRRPCHHRRRAGHSTPGAVPYATIDQEASSTLRLEGRIPAPLRCAAVAVPGRFGPHAYHAKRQFAWKPGMRSRLPASVKRRQQGSASSSGLHCLRKKCYSPINCRTRPPVLMPGRCRTTFRLTSCHNNAV